MKDQDDSVAYWLAALRTGTPVNVEAAQEKLIAHYAAGLRALVCRRLHAKVAAMEPPTAVVNSAFNAVFTDGMREAKDRDSLWRLLSEIVVCKTYNLNRHHFRQCRDLRLSKPLTENGALDERPADRGAQGNGDKRRYRKDVKAPPLPEPSSIVNGDTVRMFTLGAQPEHAAIVSEALKALGDLEPIARLFIKGCGKHEIAKSLNLSPKTVTRKLEQIARTLSEQQ